MSSLAQITANQQNAVRSTGPVTPEGKLASSKNSLSHGLRSNTIVLPGEDQAEYDDLLKCLMAYYRPSGPVQTAHVQRIASCTWRLKRIAFIEAELFDSAESLGEAWLLQAPAFMNLMRHENSLDRSRTRAEKELERLKQMPEPPPQLAAVEKIGFVRAELTKPPKPSAPPPPKLFVDCRSGKVTHVTSDTAAESRP